MKQPTRHLSETTRACGWAALAALLLLTAFLFRQHLELTMARHMLVQIPMLLASGAAWHRCLTHLPRMKAVRCYAASWDEYGLAGLAIFVLVTAYWMIPRALDSAVASGTVELAKFATLFIAGLHLPASLSRANIILQLFFLGNFASMMAIVGMLYQDTSTRLCNFYLIDDQVVAGVGLVVLAIVVPALWCASQKQVREFFKDGQTDDGKLAASRPAEANIR
ncbi:MAG TPA: hypothetical protein VJ698_02235 [Noviherbaspirillum sp.]|uniref:hypothetical protein n=1 Tax=Noviherbaspirillum sp. TaxID=1926288 RepID=UPI002B46A587|nr:hypothetical protein [Noviherbaspirillum sp.]HJV84266.1 hypothetical protein [Noviherbaspirillum sp.]